MELPTQYGLEEQQDEVVVQEVPSQLAVVQYPPLQVRPSRQSVVLPHAAPLEPRVAEHFLVPLEEPVQYWALVQQVELVEQAVPLQLVVLSHLPVLELQVVPDLQ